MHIKSQSSQDEFKDALEPFLEMLEEREKTLSKAEWVALVNSTKERIQNAPDQYLPGNKKPSENLKIAIEDIFKERLN